MELEELRRWFLDHRLPCRIVACKARRAGMSTGVQATMYHDTTFNPNTNTLIVSNQSSSSENVLNMATTFWRSTPDDLGVAFKPRLPASYKDKPPRDRLHFEDIDSRYFIATARSLDQYLGYHFNNVHATEVAYYPDGDGLMRALTPTMSKAVHSMLVLESTPNGMGGRGFFFYEQTMKALYNLERDVRQAGAFRLLFVPWWKMRRSFRLPFETQEEAARWRRTLSGEERDLVRLYDLDLEQLQWRRFILMQAPFNGDPEYFDQEYPTDLATAFLSRGKTVYGRKNIKRLTQRKRHPEWIGDIHWGESDKDNEHTAARDAVRRPRLLREGDAIANGFASHVIDGARDNLRVYRWPTKGERVFVCGDVGKGSVDTPDGDFSVLQVGVLGDLFARDEVIMTWRGRLNPLLFAEVASALCWAILRMVGDQVRAPELTLEFNGPGGPANAYLDRANLYPNTFRWIATNVHGQPKTRHLGWESNEKTKAIMVAYSVRAIEQDSIDVPDAQTILEMSSYQEFGGGAGGVSEFGGTTGNHDDTVSAFQILAVRLRQEAGTGDVADVAEPVDDWRGDPDDVPFDPHADVSERELEERSVIADEFEDDLFG